MSIRKEETSLTQAQYDALLATRENPLFEVVARKVNLDFAISNTYGLSGNDDANFDAFIDDTYFIHATDKGVQVWTLDGSKTSGFFAVPFNAKPGVAPSIESQFGYIVYWGSSNGVRGYELLITENASDLSLQMRWHAAFGSGDIEHLASTDYYTVYHTVYDAAKSTSRFWRVGLDPVGIRVISASSIYWPYPIQSWDAVSLDDDTDVVVMMAMIPGTVSIRTQGTEIIKEMEASGGVISFTVKDGVWSDHREVEIVDNMTNWHFRRGVKITKIDGTLYVSVFSVDGTKDYPIGFYRYYTSQDGLYWSMGRSLPLDSGHGQHGVKIIKHSGLLYAIEKGMIQTATATYDFGEDPASHKEDLTDLITDLSLGMDSIGDLNFEMSDDGRLAQSSVLTPENTIWIEIRMGYMTSEGPVTLRIGEFQLDTFVKTEMPGDESYTVSARNFMQWMSDRSQSEEAHYWRSQLIGGDNYADRSGTNYGGLRHTATQRGSFTTENNQLTLRSNNEEGIAFDTFKYDIWNGSKRIKFHLSTNSGTEFGGIVFRAIDPDNLWIAYYRQDEDRIELVQRIGGENTTVAYTASLGWANQPDAWRYIRADFRYGYIKVLRSDDGVTWSVILTHITQGIYRSTNNFSVAQKIVPDKGYVGVIGQGYSPPIEWDLPDFNIPDIRINVPDFNFDFNFDFSFNALGGAGDLAIAVNNAGKFARTGNLRSSNVVWDDLSDLGYVWSACLDYTSPFVLTGLGTCAAYAVIELPDGSLEVHRTENLVAQDVIWTSVFTSDDKALTGSKPQVVLRCDKTSPGVVYLIYSNSSAIRVYRSLNSGTDWALALSRGIDDENIDASKPYSADSVSGGVFFQGSSEFLRDVASVYHIDDANTPKITDRIGGNRYGHIIADGNNDTLYIASQFSVPGGGTYYMNPLDPPNTGVPTESGVTISFTENERTNWRVTQSANGDVKDSDTGAPVTMPFDIVWDFTFAFDPGFRFNGTDFADGSYDYQYFIGNDGFNFPRLLSETDVSAFTLRWERTFTFGDDNAIITEWSELDFEPKYSTAEGFPAWYLMRGETRSGTTGTRNPVSGELYTSMNVRITIPGVDYGDPTNEFYFFKIVNALQRVETGPYGYPIVRRYDDYQTLNVRSIESGVVLPLAYYEDDEEDTELLLHIALPDTDNNGKKVHVLYKSTNQDDLIHANSSESGSDWSYSRLSFSPRQIYVSSLGSVYYTGDTLLRTRADDKLGNLASIWNSVGTIKEFQTGE